jgi:hypothetical protein
MTTDNIPRYAPILIGKHPAILDNCSGKTIEMTTMEQAWEICSIANQAILEWQLIDKERI